LDAGTLKKECPSEEKLSCFPMFGIPSNCRQLQRSRNGEDKQYLAVKKKRHTWMKTEIVTGCMTGRAHSM
jgi:hypothetical protein